jgi:hypothetical protein
MLLYIHTQLVLNYTDVRHATPRRQDRDGSDHPARGSQRPAAAGCTAGLERGVAGRQL